MNEIVLSEKTDLSYYEGFLHSLSCLANTKIQKVAWLDGNYSKFN